MSPLILPIAKQLLLTCMTHDTLYLRSIFLFINKYWILLGLTKITISMEKFTQAILTQIC